MTEMHVRAFYRTTQVAGFDAPWDNLAIKVYYPCAYGGTLEERNTGFIPADPALAPFPVVIILPGVNVSHEGYSWLAHRLAAAGLVTATYSWIGREMEDLISVTPGVDLPALTPEGFGNGPSCPAIAPLLEELERINGAGLLAGLLDLDSIFLGGHSAGGTMALLNGNRAWFPSIRGTFSYAAHTAASKPLGWPEHSMLPLTGDVPLLLMGGDRDGVIEASGFRYGNGEASDPTGRIERTFEESVPGGRGDCHLLIVRGANHFSFCHPADTATGRPFLDHPEEGSGSTVREFMAEVIAAFCGSALQRPGAAATLQTLCDSNQPLAAIARTR